MKEIREIIRFWEARRGRPLALATLVAAQGSSYRRPGARMIIDDAGAAAGGLSAGCIEEEVIACARNVLHTGVPQLMTFDTRLRFGCHGTIEIFVEPAAQEFLVELHECSLHRQSCRLETVTHGDARGTRIASFENVPGAFAANLRTSSERLTAFAPCSGESREGLTSFVQTIDPVLRLILIGDSSDTIALRNHATFLGWDVLQLDAAPVPAHLLDERTAVVVATHNFGRDCAALRNLLPAGLRYVGLIGSRRRRDDLLFDVMDCGTACQSSLFAPAGLHLGAESPEEIALSIVAEIQCVFGAGTAQQLRHRKAPIHDSAPGPVACAELVA